MEPIKREDERFSGRVIGDDEQNKRRLKTGFFHWTDEHFPSFYV